MNFYIAMKCLTKIILSFFILRDLSLNFSVYCSLFDQFTFNGYES